MGIEEGIERLARCLFDEDDPPDEQEAEDIVLEFAQDAGFVYAQAAAWFPHVPMGAFLFLLGYETDDRGTADIDEFRRASKMALIAAQALRSCAFVMCQDRGVEAPPGARPE